MIYISKLSHETSMKIIKKRPPFSDPSPYHGIIYSSLPFSIDNVKSFLFPEQLGVASDPDNFHYVRHRIYPNKKKVVAYMTLHAVLVIAYQLMGLVLAWDRLPFL